MILIVLEPYYQCNGSKSYQHSTGYLLSANSLDSGGPTDVAPALS
jgi:hypothetical protein